MAHPLEWKEGEGYDIHVLRGGPSSKPLDTAVVLDTSTNAFPPKFDPHFKGAPNNHGVDVFQGTGEVTAAAHPASPQPKFPNFNFLITASQVVGGSTLGPAETQIRVHVHDTIQKIWLTPASLTIHRGADETRFTVLALFDDGTVGDITDWPQLKFQSSDTNAVKVLNPGDTTENGEITTTGVLSAQGDDDDAEITVTLDVTAPPIHLTAKAMVFTKPSWVETGKSATVRFVTGGNIPVPNPKDTHGTDPDSVDMVVKNRVNILFVSEGFQATQEKDFLKIVEKIVNTQLRTSANLEPFKILADSINYWTAFTESPDEGTTVLGNQEVLSTISPSPTIPVPYSVAPDSSAQDWTTANMHHQAGLPRPVDTPFPDPEAWATARKKIYDLPSGLPNNPFIDLGDLDAWNTLGKRTLLNELDTAFGMAHFDRPRAVAQYPFDGRLMHDPRRTSLKSIMTFLENLGFGQQPQTNLPYSLGDTWIDGFRGRGKDVGLVCFVCHSGTLGGSSFKRGGVSALADFFTASTGRGERALVTTATNGRDLHLLPPLSGNFSPPVMAAVVAYGIGQAVGLQDEDNSGEGASPSNATLILGPNLQPPSLLRRSPSGRMEAKHIDWLWPRIAKAGSVEVKIDFSTNAVLSPARCDQNGNPNATGNFLLVKFIKAPDKPFAKGDVVRLRGCINTFSSTVFWEAPSKDPIASFPLFVESVGADTAVLGHAPLPATAPPGYLPPAAGTRLEPAMFVRVLNAALIGPRIAAGTELKLIADPIFKQIDNSQSALNAPPGSQGATCKASSHRVGDVPATNLRASLKLPKGLPSRADLIGIYDGGFNFDCGVYRPAGRCRMRRKHDATTPFCHVCRYVIVDRLDPAMHGPLDDLYDLQYP